MTANFLLSRRAFVAGAAAAGIAACVAPGIDTAVAPIVAPIPVNPLVRQRADAQIFRHADGLYYMMASVPEYDRLVIRRAPTIAGLSSAEEVVVWRRPAKGKLAGHIWAPELHHMDGRWYIYFAAGDEGDVFHIRTYVLESAARDPFDPAWKLLGQLETPWATFNLDSTVYEHRGTRYLLWAQREPGIETNSNLYIAPMASPTTLARAPARLTVPTLPWEIQGFKVAEGAAVLNRNGRLFLTYSGSATDARYAMGMLTADEDADVMDPRSWTKSPTPVFSTSAATGVYGPGHNSFTVDEQGRDVLVYHGRDYEKIEGDPLYDPNRHTRVQRIYYRADGTPDFGIPVGNGPVPDRFSPRDRPGAFLRLEGERLVVGEGPLPTTQIRRVQGFVGEGTVLLEPILTPGRYLRGTAAGTVVLASNDGTRAFAEEASFHAVPGLADARGISLRAVGAPGSYLHHRNGGLMVSAPAGAASATFLTS